MCAGSPDTHIPSRCGCKMAIEYLGVAQRAVPGALRRRKRLLFSDVAKDPRRDMPYLTWILSISDRKVQYGVISCGMVLMSRRSEEKMVASER